MGELSHHRLNQGLNDVVFSVQTLFLHVVLQSLSFSFFPVKELLRRKISLLLCGFLFLSCR